MSASEAMRIAWEAILKNKVRSFLTMLGIIIGVAAVIIMIAISAGTEAEIQEQITSLGSNLIFVQAAFTRGGPGQAQQGGLVYDDAAAIQQGVDGVISVVVEQESTQNVKAGDVTLQDVELLGTTSEFPSVRDMELAGGRYFTNDEIDRKAKVAVLGSAAAASLFGTESAVGQYVTVDTTKLAVIGVFKERGLVGNTDFDFADIPADQVGLSEVHLQSLRPLHGRPDPDDLCGGGPGGRPGEDHPADRAAAREAARSDPGHGGLHDNDPAGHHQHA